MELTTPDGKKTETLVAYFQALIIVNPKNFRAARAIFFRGPLRFLQWAALTAEIVGREF